MGDPSAPPCPGAILTESDPGYPLCLQGIFIFIRKGCRIREPGTSGDDFQHEKLTEAGQANALSGKQTHKMTVYRTAVPIHTILPVMTGFLRPGAKQMIRLPGPWGML